jgi:hypothetical protein
MICCVTGREGQRAGSIFTYTAEPGSRSEQALNLLASWAATPDQAEPAPAADST